jgi:hypothetical protein
MSFIEETTKRVVVLFVVAPAVSLIWLPMQGMEVTGYWHGVLLSWPFVVVALVTGWAIRRGFNKL